MKNKGVIAILGGMGPEASARMLQVMVDMASKEFGAKRGTDFPEIIMDSVPVPDFFESEENLHLAKAMLKKRVKDLSKMNPNCFAIACNTAHILLCDLETETDVPFVSIIEAVVDRICRSSVKKVGLLATPMTIHSALFQSQLCQQGVGVLEPNERQLDGLKEIVRKVIAGKAGDLEQNKLLQIATDLRRRGAEGIILGCTELPLVFPKSFEIPVFDSVEILVRALLERRNENG